GLVIPIEVHGIGGIQNKKNARSGLGPAKTEKSQKKEGPNCFH
ncbi:MAG: hypothetical protein RL751_1899, partial [Bacteroidota bacterium]